MAIMQRMELNEGLKFYNGPVVRIRKYLYLRDLFKLAFRICK